MANQSNTTPQGFHSVTPMLTFRDCSKAIEFYQSAFGAKVIDHLPSPDGKGTMHATIKIGDSILMMGDEMPQEGCGKSAETLGGSPISLFIYVPNVDEAFDRAAKAGGKVTMPVADMFWGDRCGSLTDPFGYSWMLGTNIKTLSKDEIQKAAQEFFSQAQA